MASRPTASVGQGCPAHVRRGTRQEVERGFGIHAAFSVSVERGLSLVGKTLAQVEKELDLTIVQYKGAAKTDLHPDPDIVIEGDACITVFAELGTLGKLNALAKRKG